MSFFYLSPVKGNLPVHLLEEITTSRFQYLQDLVEGNNIAYNQFIVEGSIYDNVGHFMLCVAAILNKNVALTKFILKGEVELFKRRVGSLTAYDMRCFSKKLLRNIKKYDKIPSFIVPLQSLCQHLMLKDVAQHFCASAHMKECSQHHIKIHFRHCLPFIAKRQVEVQQGIALLPCGKWKQYLVLLFTMNIKSRLGNTDLTPLRSDPRINELLFRIRKETSILQNSRSEIRTLKSVDVDSVSASFPPCMLNLHRYLRNKHRLSHTQRFYYSLFLKDIGLNVNEAVDFWRAEYRQAPNGKHSCCHNWEKDEKKYLYGIRHMYGLEGGRKNYTSYNCKQIQSTDISCLEGGCPFKSFDEDNMMKILGLRRDDLLLSQINELKSKNMYTSACILFLEKKCSIVCDNTMSFNFSPVNFFQKSTSKI
ncbi:uncharacterized protein LOC128672295 [Plodia interpunctella]|uniref:uncharacterized protein LOC128672295 n=1 Tax=Plodia interpunctella TaxID=58824 RepID=UPI0023678AA7|nr:uncharacterized protein LOC128672295 [Plodia interpunctella]